jgi:uncharacterized protein
MATKHRWALVVLLAGTLAFSGAGCSCRRSAPDAQATEAYQRGDFETAAAQFKSVADTTKDPKALCTLGFMHYTGRGVPRNLRKAREFYEQAAAKNDVTAQFSLGTMHENGEGVPRNPVEAMFWYSLAARQGDVDAKRLLTELRPRLTADQREMIEKRVNAWRPRP